MKLQEALKQLISQFGEDIVGDIKLANLLADFNAYGEYPAMKQIFKDSQKAGYGVKLLEAYRQDPKTAIEKALNYSQEFAKVSKYKQDLISYGFDSILFGLGCLSNINEPLSKGFDPYSKADDNILDNLSNLLSSYQKQYLDLLDRLITLPKDILNDAPGFYSTEALNKLYAIKAKIYALQQQLNKKDYDWCKIKKYEKLSYYKQQKEDAVSKTLVDLKKSYNDILSSSIIIPKSFFIKRSGYYDKNTLSKLSKIEESIKRAYYNMNKQYDNWCLKVRNNCLDRYKVATNSIVQQVIWKIGIPTAILFIVTISGISYTSSSESIATFEQTIASGEQYVTKGDYSTAFKIFYDAKNSYNASFIPSYYKGIADKHITENINRLTEECYDLLSQKKYASVKSLINSVPDNLLSENKTGSDNIERIQFELNKAIENAVDHMILNISKNNGHLDESSKEELKELLIVNSDDYWLNFIQKKEK